jgi:hypothetical protein
MMSPCDSVTERLALGEPLGADDDAHVAACPACARLIRLPGLVAATAREAEPGPGFSSCMQVGARAELGARRRARIASVTLAAAAAVLLGGVFVTRHNRAENQSTAIDPFTERQPINLPGEHRDTPSHDPHDRARPAHQPATDDHLAAHLVRLADLDGALAPQAPWRRIEAPLAPYRSLLVHVRQGVH